MLSAVLGVVYRTISGHLLGGARLTRRTGHTGAVTLIQRFGSALNLNVHLHMIFVDGAYRSDGTASPVFHPVPAPATADLQALVQRIAERLGRMLEKRGLIERDAETAWLSADPGQSGALDDLIGHSITYRIAVGPRAGQKLFTLQTVRAQPAGAGRHGAAEAGGFSLHAGLEIQPGERAKLERLCRYVSRPPVATERLALTPSRQVRYQLKAPCRDGTTHIVLESLDLMARLAALVPPPRMHLTRYHGVFAPHSRLRAAITPAGRGGAGRGREEQQAVRRGGDCAEACRDELGAAAEPGVRDRDRDLCPLPGSAACDRKHRGAGGDRAHSRALGTIHGHVRAEALADGRAGATAGGQPAVRLRRGGVGPGSRARPAPPKRQRGGAGRGRS